MSLSDRHRAEGFLPVAVTAARTQFHSQRVEGFLDTAAAVGAETYSQGLRTLPLV